MSDGHPARPLLHTVKFRLSETDHARLAQQAGVLRLRVNELARQLVTERSHRRVATPALDPAVVIQLQTIGLRLREMLASGACDAGLRSSIADLCLRIEQIIEHAISGEAAPWFR
jgi:hypothetical protein